MRQAWERRELHRNMPWRQHRAGRSIAYAPRGEGNIVPYEGMNNLAPHPMGSPFRGGSILGRYYPGLGLLGFNMSRALQIMQMRRILIGLPPRFAGMGGPGMMGPGLMGPAMMGPAMIPRGMVPPGLIQPGMPGSGGAAAPGGAGGAGGAGGKEGDKDKAPKPEASKKKTPKSDKSKSEAPKPEKSKSDKPKPEAPKQENPKSEKPKSMGPRIGKNEAVKRFQERVSGMFGGTKDGKLR
jgi:hypothetical protein